MATLAELSRQAHLATVTFAVGALLAVGGVVLALQAGSALAGLGLAVIGGFLLAFAPMLDAQ